MGHLGALIPAYFSMEIALRPEMHTCRTRWIWMIKEAISKIAYYFNNRRMMRRDAVEAWIR